MAGLPGELPAGPPARPRLAGRRIAIAEHRELYRLAEMLTAEGATAVRCPLMAILDAPDAASLLSWLRDLIAGRFDDVIFLTGEGVRRLAEAAARAGMKEPMVRSLAAVRKIARGPKPGRALRDLGLTVDLSPITPTSDGVAEALRGHVLAGRHVGLQLFGDEPSRELVAFLEVKGARVHPVAPYRYAPASDDHAVAAIVQEIAAGHLDAIVFTMAVQVERLFEVARRRGMERALAGGLARLQVAAVGPVVVRALQELGVRVDAVPARQFFMRRLIEEMVDHLGPRPG